MIKVRVRSYLPMLKPSPPFFASIQDPFTGSRFPAVVRAAAGPPAPKPSHPVTPAAPSIAGTGAYNASIIYNGQPQDFYADAGEAPCDFDATLARLGIDHSVGGLEDLVETHGLRREADARGLEPGEVQHIIQ